MPGAAKTTGGLVKTGGLAFHPDEIERLERLKDKRRSTFSEAVRVAVRHGLNQIEQLEAEGRLVA